MAAVNLLEAASLPVGQSAEVVAEGRIFAVFNVDGHFHVIDGICPHAGGPLGKGMLRGDVVTCPWHGWQFNVATGHHCLNQRMCQTVFESRIVDGNVVIDLNM
jgi:nitrite reductase/ring-hydroxylating ferredoxin subunit